MQVLCSCNSLPALEGCEPGLWAGHCQCELLQLPWAAMFCSRQVTLEAAEWGAGCWHICAGIIPCIKAILVVCVCVFMCALLSGDREPETRANVGPSSLADCVSIA